ncbi:hypothetical protein BT63DRAFT_454667 [Microthyrium microscopicum]|uniref:Uncharacterized protein n=1 Tax=Microthyrium microscopicum TaxID=703497 RepID=A0A6A6UGA5_9PEZI|nr:hypothetical protein BT63DRAFT_454667 [Microthyrium microscopicum]
MATAAVLVPVAVSTTLSNDIDSPRKIASRDAVQPLVHAEMTRPKKADNHNVFQLLDSSNADSLPQPSPNHSSAANVSSDEASLLLAISQIDSILLPYPLDTTCANIPNLLDADNAIPDSGIDKHRSLRPTSNDLELPSISGKIMPSVDIDIDGANSDDTLRSSRDGSQLSTINEAPHPPESIADTGTFSLEEGTVQTIRPEAAVSRKITAISHGTDFPKELNRASPSDLFPVLPLEGDTTGLAEVDSDVSSFQSGSSELHTTLLASDEAVKPMPTTNGEDVITLQQAQATNHQDPPAPTQALSSSLPFPDFQTLPAPLSRGACKRGSRSVSADAHLDSYTDTIPWALAEGHSPPHASNARFFSRPNKRFPRTITILEPEDAIACERSLSRLKDTALHLLYPDGSASHVTRMMFSRSLKALGVGVAYRVAEDPKAHRDKTHTSWQRQAENFPGYDINDAEVFAIFRALQMVSKNVKPGGVVVLFTDSDNALRFLGADPGTMKRSRQRDFYAERITELMTELYNRNVVVNAHWIPGHPEKCEELKRFVIIGSVIADEISKAKMKELDSPLPWQAYIDADEKRKRERYDSPPKEPSSRSSATIKKPARFPKHKPRYAGNSSLALSKTKMRLQSAKWAQRNYR